MGRPRKPQLAFTPPPATGLGPPPRRFQDDDDALDAWDWFGSLDDQEGLSTPAARQLVELYCTAKSRYLKAEADLAVDGMTVDGQFGEKPHPKLAISNACAKQMVSLLAKLGMTHNARSPQRGGGKTRDDPLSAFVASNPSHAPQAKAKARTPG